MNAAAAAFLVFAISPVAGGIDFSAAGALGATPRAASRPAFFWRAASRVSKRFAASSRNGAWSTGFALRMRSGVQ